MNDKASLDISLGADKVIFLLKNHFSGKYVIKTDEKYSFIYFLLTKQRREYYNGFIKIKKFIICFWVLLQCTEVYYMSCAERLLSEMTLREKLAQLTQLDSSFFLKYGSSELTGPMNEMQISKEDILSCGTVLGAIGADTVIEIQKKHLENDPHKIPLLFMLDIIHGFRTIFPINLALGCTWEPEMVKTAMRIAAKEAAASGISVNFAPMADLVRDPRWGRVMESTGEDPYLNSLFASAAVEGFQGDDLKDKNSLAACVKHIAGYGAAEGGRDYNTTEIGLNTLFESYMPAYKAAVDSGVKMAMASFNALNGVPSHVNKWLISGVLRKSWGFEGAVISDWGAVGELINHGVAADGAMAAEKALCAGVDIEMMTSYYLQHGENLVKSGRLSLSQIDAAVLRVLRLKEDMGLFEDPFRGASADRENESLCCKEHRKVAFRLAVKSSVLLKNENEILPLKKKQKIAVIGPFAESREILGGWSCTGRIEETVSLRDGLEAGDYECEFTFAPGCRINETDNLLLNAALATAADADLIIMALGESMDMSGEAASRTDITLPQAQQRLFDEIAGLSKPIVTVIFSGRPLILKGISERSDALMEAWFPGTEGGRALAELLFGNELPEGRLTMSFPYNIGQIPVYYNHFSTGRPIDKEYSEMRYLSRYIDAPNAPYYPFGHGLGYSSVEYDGFVAEFREGKVTAHVTVTNTGKRDMTETVQCYVRDISAEVVRPVKQLKAFKKLEIPVGESRTVKFILGRRELSYYNAEGKLIYEPGDFEIFVGRNSADVKGVRITAGECR